VVRHLNDTVETVIGKLALSAQGLVRRSALLRAGITRAEIRSRLKSGALLREFPGVYRVGHRAPSLESHYLAAVWACGDGALLSGQAAGHLRGLLKGAPPPPQVIAPGPRRIPGIVTRRYRSIAADDVTSCCGIPVTSVPRTLVDLAAVLNEQQLARACHEAGVRYGTTPAQVEEVLRRRPTAQGAGKLRAVMRGDAKVVLSRLEERFLGLCVRLA
jgi:hypothetical protein